MKESKSHYVARALFKFKRIVDSCTTEAHLGVAHRYADVVRETLWKNGSPRDPMFHDICRDLAAKSRFSEVRKDTRNHV